MVLLDATVAVKAMAFPMSGLSTFVPIEMSFTEARPAANGRSSGLSLFLGAFHRPAGVLLGAEGLHELRDLRHLLAEWKQVASQIAGLQSRQPPLMTPTYRALNSSSPATRFWIDEIARNASRRWLRVRVLRPAGET